MKFRLISIHLAEPQPYSKASPFDEKLYKIDRNISPINITT